MNIPPSEADKLTLHDYEELLWNWNASHTLSEDGDAPDGPTAMKILEAINNDPRLTR